MLREATQVVKQLSWNSEPAHSSSLRSSCSLAWRWPVGNRSLHCPEESPEDLPPGIIVLGLPQRLDFGKNMVVGCGSRGHCVCGGGASGKGCGGISVPVESEQKESKGMTFHPGNRTISSTLFVVSLWSIRKYNCKTTILDGAVPLR